MIIGTTNFQDGQELYIQSGKNDKLSFYAGASKQYTIAFPPDSYSKEEIIDYINQDLASKGEDSVRAIPYGTNNIAITSDKYVITGLSGNMIEIDGITSIIYDIAKQGNVDKNKAYYYGRANLTNGVTIIRGENDTLRLRANDSATYETIQLLKDEEIDEVTLTGADIKNRLEEAFSNLNMDIKVGLSAGTLRLDSNLYGSISRIHVDQSSPAHDILFNQQNVYYYTLDISRGTSTVAAVEGNFGLADHTTIDSTNNIFNIRVDGTSHTLTLEQKDYTNEELVTELNEKLSYFGIAVSASLKQGANGKSALVITHHNEGTGRIDIYRASNPSYDTLFGGTRVYQPTFTRGTTGSPQYPPEGEIGDVIIPTTPATVRGQVDLFSGITITDENQTISFSLNGDQTAITLAEGSYSPQMFVDEINRHLDPSVATATLMNGRYLLLTSIGEGSSQSKLPIRFRAWFGKGNFRYSF